MGKVDLGAAVLLGERQATTPDTITRRIHKLSEAAGLPKINLHDVRHSYATAGRDAKIDWKALSQRIGRADVAFTMEQYVQTDLEADRQVATALAGLIIGGSLASVDTSNSQSDGDISTNAQAKRTPAGPPTKVALANPLASSKQKALP